MNWYSLKLIIGTWVFILIYRHTSFYSSLLYCTLQILCFLQIKGLQQPCVEQVHGLNFSTAFAHFVSLCHSLAIPAIFHFFITITLVMVICDL